MHARVPFRRLADSTALALAATAALLAAPALADTAVVKLSGSEEVPPVDSDNVGECLVILDDDTQTQLTVACSHTAEEPIAWHIHRGAEGNAGPVFLDPAEAGESPFGFVFDLANNTQGLTAEETLALLLTEQLYINVHTPTAASGEIRGQIRMTHDVDQIETVIQLTGAEETPPVDTDASGVCRAVLDPDTNHLQIACTHDIEDAIAAHIHPGARGVAGPPEIDFGDATSPIFHEVDLTDEQEERFLTGGYYVNVHSPAHASGEIRGQLDACQADDRTLCLLGGRFEARVTFTDFENQEHVGRSVRETDDSGMFWFLEPNNLELLLKMVDACSFNDRFWVFFAATTDTAFELTVRDTLTGETKTYTNELGNPADAVTDTDAFATCPAPTP